MKRRCQRRPRQGARFRAPCFWRSSARPCLSAESRPAAAFEIFGIKLWGSSSDEDADIVDPLRYAVTIDGARRRQGSGQEARKRLGAEKRRGTPGFRLARADGQGAQRPRTTGRGTLRRCALRRRGHHHHPGQAARRLAAGCRIQGSAADSGGDQHRRRAEIHAWQHPAGGRCGGADERRFRPDRRRRRRAPAPSSRRRRRSCGR